MLLHHKLNTEFTNHSPCRGLDYSGIGIDRDLYVLIRDKAKTMRKPEEALINEWLAEKERT